eukprot:9434390-Pyramimonas_sp.AAC.1
MPSSTLLCSALHPTPPYPTHSTYPTRLHSNPNLLYSTRMDIPPFSSILLYSTLLDSTLLHSTTQLLPTVLYHRAKLYYARLDSALLYSALPYPNLIYSTLLNS